MDTFLRDLRFAFRVLRKSPGFTLTAVLTLGLTIGANTAVFSVVDALLIRPLPYPEPDRLAQLATRYESRGGTSDQLSHDGRMWQLLRDHAKTIDAAVYSDFNLAGGVNLLTEAGPTFVSQQRVSARFFRVLGVSPLIGREFDVNEDVPNGPAVAMLSHRLWQRAFGGDPSVIGWSIHLKGEPYTVVGVMPDGFRSSMQADVWTPIRPSTTGEGEGTNYGIIARLRAGETWERANAEVGAIGAERFKERHVSDSRATYLKPLQTGRTDVIRPQLMVLWGAVLVVLVIACVNIAGLLLARGGTRTRELATRMALGGSRGDVVRLLLVESIVIAIAGALLGLVLGRAALDLLADAARQLFGVWEPLALDGRIVAITLVVSVMCALGFGLAPAWQASRLDVQTALAQTGTRGSTAASRWPRRMLIVAEVALGVVLLVCAGLLVRTFMSLRGLPPGFDSNGVVAATVSLDAAEYRNVERMTRLFEDSLARIRQSPGVESAAVSLGMPYTRLLNLGFKRLDGVTSGSPASGLTNLSYITPDYFRTLRIPVVAGRSFAAQDTADAEGVLIVNEAFVRQHFRDRDPVGRRVALSGRERTIVGVVGNVQFADPGWGDYGPIAAPPVCYIPVTQTSPAFLRVVHTWFSPAWIVRSARGTQGLEGVVRSAIASADARLPVARFQSLEHVRSEATSGQRFMAMLLLSLGAIAALLAAIGIHGLIAASVTERTRELGIRMALGATPGQAMRAVTGMGVILALAGVVLGSLLSVAAVKTIKSQLWGVAPGDPLTFAGVGVALLAVAVAASTLPARRILRLDPAVSLRAE